MATSPYKKMKTANTNYVQYVSCKQLKPHKPYKVYKIFPTTHEKYGDGYMAYYLKGPYNLLFKVQIPGKYLAMFELPGDIDAMIKDIEKRQNPYFIFREELPNKSFWVDMDILPTDPAVVKCFEKKDDYPELNDSNASDKNEAE